MFERRPLLGVLLALNLCVLIWRISVQDTAMLSTAGVYGTYTIGSGSTTGSANINFPQIQQQQEQQQQIKTQKQTTQAPQTTKELPDYLDFLSLQAPQQQQKLYNFRYSQKVGTHLPLYQSKTSTTHNAVTQPKLRRMRKITKNWLAERNVNLHLSNLNEISKSYNSNSKKTFDSTELFNYEHKVIAAATPPTISPTVNANINTVSLQMPISVTSSSKLPLSASFARHLSSTAFFPSQILSTDVKKLIDLNDFVYLMPKNSCDAHIEALIVVHSAPNNFEKRALIRETWGGAVILRDSPMRLLFLIGAVHKAALQVELLQENAIYDDIVQGRFIDNYRNMTYKHVMGLKWFLYNCAHAQLLIKVDDDVFVNTPQLLKYMSIQQNQQKKQQHLQEKDKTHIKTTVAIHTTANNANTNIYNLKNASHFNASQTLFRNPKNLLFCEQHSGALIKRTYRSKWRVSFKEYPGHYYPSYCPGYAIIYSSDVVQRLYMAAQQHKYFWIDDVHITGSLAQLTNINITTLKDYVLYSDQCKSLLTGKTDLNEVEFLFAWHNITPEQMRALWRLLIDFYYIKNVNSNNYRKTSKVKENTNTTTFVSVPSPPTSLLSSLLSSPVVNDFNANHIEADEDLYAYDINDGSDDGVAR